MKAKSYRSIRGQLYTRLEYIKASPHTRITKFNMGVDNPDYDVELSLVANERVLIRDNALEAVRISVNRNLSKRIKDEFYLTIIPFPHHILRENKMMTGAGADRLSEGMRRAFGKVSGRAAAVEKGQKILTVKTFKKNIEVVKRALKIASSKIPKGGRILIEPLAKTREES